MTPAELDELERRTTGRQDLAVFDCSVGYARELLRLARLGLRREVEVCRTCDHQRPAGGYNEKQCAKWEPKAPDAGYCFHWQAKDGGR